MQEADRYNLYRKVFKSTAGILVLTDIMETFDGLGNEYHVDPREAERMAGHRDVIRHILDSLGTLHNYEKIVRAFLTIPAPKPKERQKEADA